MLRHGAVGGLELILAVRRHEDARHHGEGAEGSGDHVAHDVAVIVLAGPDVAALGADRASHGVVDQRVEIRDAELFKLRLVILVFLLEDALELRVVGLGDRVLGGEPEVLFLVDRVLEAAARELADGIALVVHALEDGRAADLLDADRLLGPALADEGEAALAGLVRAQLHGLVHVAVSVAGDGDGLFPAAHRGLHRVDQDRRAEDRAAHDGADRPVGAGPLACQLRVLHHALGVGGDRGALHRDAVLQRGVGGVHRDLVARGVAVQKPEVIVFRVQLHEGRDQLVLDLLPQNAGHLVAVHLNERRRHLDLFHAHPSAPQPAA